MGCPDRSKVQKFYLPTCDARIVESINTRFFRSTENNNRLSPKVGFYTHQILHVLIVVEKHNELPGKDQKPEQPLVNQEIPIQPIVEPASLAH